MIILFPDQEKSIDLLRQSMKRNKSVLLQGETGSGKSIMASYMIKESQKKGISSAFIIPRKDLLYQMSETFSKHDIEYSFVAAGRSLNPFSKTHICMVGSFLNRLDKIKPKIIFADECHFAKDQIAKISRYYKSHGVWFIGLTATPEYPDGSGIDQHYDDMILGPTIRELIDLKRLSDYRMFAPSSPDLSAIKVVNGEYSKGQLDSYMMDASVLIGDAVHHYKTHAMGKLNMSFCTSILHSKKTAAQFNDAGIPSAHMDAETPEHERRRIAKAFANRELLNICTVDLCLFGYDLAASSGVSNVTVESMSDLRPTKSRTVQRQKNGRVLRYKDFPALIFDHSSNHRIHDMPDAEIKWSMQGRDKKQRETGEKTMSLKQCDRCFFVHKPAPVCPNCSNVYEIMSREIDEIDGELVEIDIKATERTRIDTMKQKLDAATTLDDLRVIRKENKYHTNWVSRWAKIKGIKA